MYQKVQEVQSTWRYLRDIHCTNQEAQHPDRNPAAVYLHLEHSLQEEAQLLQHSCFATQGIFHRFPKLKLA